MRGAAFAAAVAAALLLAACGEKVQTNTPRKSDAQAFEGAAAAFTAAGWKPGDAASWEQQMRTRAQGQNEYSRAAAQ